MFKKAFICIFLVITSLAFAYSDQVVVSQFDIGLKMSNSNNNYSLTGVTKSGDIKAVQSVNLSSVIDFNGSIGGSFAGSPVDLKFNYATAEKSIIIPVVKNSGGTITKGSFQLSETSTMSGETMTTYLIQDNISLPAPISDFQKITADTGAKFTYTDSAKIAHISAYKKQEFIVRIAKASVGNTDYDVIGENNGIKLANSTSNAKSFLDGDISYVDFLVSADQYDKAQNITTNVGLNLKFMPGNIEIFGLPKGNYRIELYSFRYSKEVTTKGNVVITKEGNIAFTIGNTEFLEEGIDIINFSSSEFPKVSATILTIGNITNPAISVTENGATMGRVISATTGAIYVDSTSTGALNIGINGTEYGGKYYQLWDVSYEALDKVIKKGTREVIYNITNWNKSVKTFYDLISSEAQYTEKPLYQTVFVGFKDSTYTNGEYEIDDRIMNKYSDGYRSLRTANVSLTSGAIDIEKLYRGVSSSAGTFNNSYNWTLNQGTHNSLIISKAISDSKATYKKIGDTSKNFTFYTTEWDPSLTFYETSDENNNDDTVKIKWQSPKKSSYDVTLSESKVMFRIIKSGANSESLRYKPESNSNPIMASTNANLSSFLTDTTKTKYFDLVFTSGEDGKVNVGNAEFSFSKENNLKLVGLDVGTYQVQIYSIQDEDTFAKTDFNFDYRVLTFGMVLDNIIFGLPELEKDKYSTYDNPYIIDTINVATNSSGQKEVEVGVIIKADQQIGELTKNNLIARKDEEATSSAFYFSSPGALMVEAWKPNYSSSTGAVYTDVKAVDPSVINVFKSTKADFKYPLDIVFLIDNSGSMQNEINSVRDGLKAFSKDLSDRGYDLNYNVIQFGRNSPVSVSSWFTDVNNVVTHFSGITASGGYTYRQENGAEAIHNGISQLRTKGRYLNRKLGIWTTADGTDQKYMPSKKWIILLTDENMDKDQSSSLGYNTDRTSDKFVVKELANKLVAINNGFQDNITLTGIFHLNTLMTNLDNNSSNSASEARPTANTNTTYIDKFKNAIISEGAKIKIHSNGYIYKRDTSNPKGYIGNYSGNSNYIGAYEALEVTDKLGNSGTFPSDSKDIFYTEFAMYAGKLFSMYEMGETGEYVSKALEESVKDIGIIQRWIIKYISPYGKEFYDEKDKKIKGGNDGERREVIFSLYNVKNYKGELDKLKLTSAIDPIKLKAGEYASARHYYAPTTKLEAYFVNPNESNRYLEKVDEKINLKAKARSQYKKKINGEMQWVNYPITKGTFVITGNFSNDGITAGVAVTKTISTSDKGTELISIKDVVEENSTWYYVDAELDSKAFTTRFGKKPMNVVVTFIAETAEESKTITLSGVTVVDKTAPKITDFTITNKTLNTFMNSLTNLDSSKLYLSTEISSATIGSIKNSEGIKASDFETTSGSKVSLNAKGSDKIKVELTIEDESITASSTGVTVVYNGKTYVATYVSTDGTNPDITKWKIELDSFSYVSDVNNISINVTDNSLSPNNTTITGNVFEEPALIKGTTLKPRSNVSTDSDYNIAGSSFNNYYNNIEITTTDKNNEALAYLMIFNPYTAEKDAGSTNIITYPTLFSQPYQLSKDGNFKFGDGRYKYSEVFVINKAGGIARANEPLTKVTYDGSLGGAVTTLNVISKEREFFVDTVRPDIRYLSLDKISDNNLSSLLGGNSLASSILLGPTSSTRPYKGGDGIELKTTIAEYNFLKSTLSQIGILDIMSGMRTYNGNTELTANSVTGAEERSIGLSEHFSGGASEFYIKRGTANDLSSGTDSSVTGTLEFTVYDKAGNISLTNVSVNYDDTIPNNISVASRVSGGGFKYTDNGMIPLDSRTGTNYSVGLLVNGAQNYIGDLRGTGTINLTSFRNNLNNPYNPIVNSHNIFSLRTFSRSGVAGNIQEDHIILDRAINDSKTSIIERAYNFSDSTYRVNLSNALSSINELVGLSSYKISTDSSNVKLSNGTIVETINASGLEVDLSALSGYNNSPNSTAYTSTNTIMLPSSGKTKYKIVLTDRLGNTKTIDYTIEIPNNIKIIGKTSGSTKQIESKVNNASSKIKVESRKE